MDTTYHTKSFTILLDMLNSSLKKHEHTVKPRQNGQNNNE